MKSLYDIHKSLNKVAKIVKLSPEMVRQFLKINNLDEKVKELIKSGLIKGIDIGYRTSKLGEKDQTILAKHVVDQNLSSDDVRAIVRYKIDNPETTMEGAINRVIQSKNRKVYVTYLGIERDTFEKLSEKIETKVRTKIIRSIFNNDIVPHEFMVSFELNGRVIILKVLKEGLQKMRNKSKELKVPLAKLADALMKEYLKETK